MRKTQFELTDMQDIVGVIDRSVVCRLAINDGDFPYIIPLNFGYHFENQQLTLYFHSAGMGKKIELLKQNNKVSFEFDAAQRVVFADKACDFAMEYESVIGRGEITFLEQAEKTFALKCLMRQYDKTKVYDHFDEKVLEKTMVLSLKVSAITGKRIKK